MSGPDIFLSYARQDRDVARMFAECLIDEGFSVWWDASLHSGETFDEVIEQQLKDAKAVVVLWSPRSVASRWVRAEATQADRKRKLVPAMIEPCDRPVIFELTHTADLCEWTGDITDIHWRTFMDDLRRLTHIGSDSEIPADARPAARAKPSTSGEQAAGRCDFASRSRPPLRPGNDEVIFANRLRRPVAVQPPVAREPLSAELPAQSDIHCLEIEGGELTGAAFPIASSGVKIGRTLPADIVLADNSVSREHCIIGLASDELLVTDLNSTNGTYIDDVRLTRATILPVGSVLRVGQIALRHTVRNDAEAEPQSLLPNSSGGGLRGRVAATS